jgi:uncharacterized protein (TIGR03083 family)
MTVVHDDAVTTSPTDEAAHQRFIEAVVEEGERFGIVAQELATGRTPTQGGLDAAVPWIPEWTARDLVGHLGTVHRWATAILRAGHTERPGREATQHPPVESLLDWYATGLTELVATLRTTPPDAPAWHFNRAADQIAASWARRQAHELIVHRMDLETAAGLPLTAVDPQLAEDGVDELLTIILPRWARTEPLVSADATVAVGTTDTGRAWSVRVHEGAVTVRTDRSGTEDAVVTGTAGHLLLHLWGRPSDVTVDGDPAAEALLRGR